MKTKPLSQRELNLILMAFWLGRGSKQKAARYAELAGFDEMGLEEMIRFVGSDAKEVSK